MKLADSILTVRRILGQEDKTESQERRYRIEHQALMDVYEGHPYDESRWNITEAYIYREAWIRGSEQVRIEGKGTLTKEAIHDDGTQHEQRVSCGSGTGQGQNEGTDGDHASCR